MLKAFRVPITWTDLVKRTASEVVADNCLGLAAQLAYYFFLALFPALLFFVALASFLPVSGLMDTVTGSLARVAPNEVLSIVQAQIIAIAHEKNGGLLTLGMLGAIWSTSSGVTAIIDTLNQAYDVQEARPWWKVQLISLALTIALALFILLSFAVVLAIGPKIFQWPVAFALVSLGMALIYYYAPDVKQKWIWITPGSVLATVLWLLTSIAFKFYVVHFTSYNATYGAIGAVIVLMLWFYVSSLAVLVGAELNAEIEHASPYGKEPGEKVAGEKEVVARAERHAGDFDSAGMLNPALAATNCDVEVDLPPASGRRVRASDWVLGTIALGIYFFRHWLKVRPLPAAHVKSVGRGSSGFAMQKRTSSPDQSRIPSETTRGPLPMLR